MLGPDDVGVHDTGGGIQGVDSGVDAQLSDGAGQHGGGVQVSEGGGRGRVSQIISGHIDGLVERNDQELSAIMQFCISLTRFNIYYLNPLFLVQFTCTDVIEPFLVVVILSCMVPMSVARVGW